MGLTMKTGEIEGQRKVIVANGISTFLGSLLGVSNVTVMAESATGIREGARSGLSTVVAGILFLLMTPFAPLAEMISDAAMVAPLVMGAMSMMSGITEITWKHVEISLPYFLTIMGTPFTFSITTGLMLGIISYTVIMVARRRAALIDPVPYTLSGVFILNMVLGAVI